MRFWLALAIISIFFLHGVIIHDHFHEGAFHAFAKDLFVVGLVESALVFFVFAYAITRRGWRVSFSTAELHRENLIE